MNNTVSRIILTDVTAPARQQNKASNAEGSDFSERLSEAIQAPERASKTEDTKTDVTETQAPEAEAQEQDLLNEEVEQEYGMQLAAIMTQTVVPIIKEAPQTEAGVAVQETAAVTMETSGTQTAQIPETQAKETSETEEATEIQQPQEDAAVQPVSEEDAESQNVLKADLPDEAQMTAAKTEQQNPRAAAEALQTQRQPGREAITITKDPAEAENETADFTGENTDRMHQAVRMHNMRHPQQQDETQSKFDSMLARAAQQLSPAVTEEAETEIIEEPALETEEPFILEAEQQEPDEQAEMPEIKPEAETKPQETAKAAVQADVKGTPKAPVTEQRQQHEMSKPDETLMGMAQQKQPEAVHETIKAEAPQPEQPQQPQAAEQAEQIKTQVVKNLETQKTEFQMQLHPEELGKVNVKMILEGGKLTVEIIAANPKSAEMLSRQADALAMSLKAGNIESTTVSVVTAPENASSHMNGQFDLNNNRFRNQEHTGRHNGTGGGKGAGEQPENGQAEPEKPGAPNRILNYSV